MLKSCLLQSKSLSNDVLPFLTMYFHPVQTPAAAYLELTAPIVMGTNGASVARTYGRRSSPAAGDNPY
jgi:hypothetical protein